MPHDLTYSHRQSLVGFWDVCTEVQARLPRRRSYDPLSTMVDAPTMDASPEGDTSRFAVFSQCRFNFYAEPYALQPAKLKCQRAAYSNE